jgi:phage terminase small subunit
VRGRVAALLNPFSQAWRNVRGAKAHVKQHNLKGYGLTMGGHLVIDTAGKVAWAHVERNFGEHPSVEKVRTATRAARPVDWHDKSLQG